VSKLQQMVGGMRGREGLRRHAFIQMCQAFTRAADAAAAAEVAASDAGTTAEGGGVAGAAAAAEAQGELEAPTAAAAAAGTVHADSAVLEDQLALLQAMQLLQVGRCDRQPCV
jgi:hypothetical protein